MATRVVVPDGVRQKLTRLTKIGCVTFWVKFSLKQPV